MNIGGIEQGVSLYGFDQRWVEDPQYTIEDVLDEVQSLGVQSFELVGAVFFDRYPRPSLAEIERIRTAAEDRGLVPFSYGGYADVGRITGHEPVDEDYILDLTADLMTARELGCSHLRAGAIPGRLLPLAAMFAEQYDVNIGIEVHAPSKPSDPDIQQLLGEFERIGSRRLGFVPDFGCFIERPAEPALARYLAAGADRERLEFVIAHRHSGLTEDEVWARVREQGGGEAERMAIADFFGFLSFGPADLDGFTTLLPWTQYFHSKFYHVTADLQDPTIPLDDLLQRILDSGFQGVLMSEYEGHAFHDGDAHGQLERHLRLEQRILESRSAR
ncbi:sugar phosphate isomerase/epimerase family protein [Humibacter sp.]|uniref:sugar phosphate isomerase/epimerase family protein n=1 Tax=Humibacter sp. TaxID=1940291 RepID=UPI003F7D3BEB